MSFIKVPIGIDKDGNEVCVTTLGISKRENAITNKKIAVNQQAKIHEYRSDLIKQMKKYPEVTVYWL